MLITKYYYSDPAENTIEEYSTITGFKVIGREPIPRITVCGIFDNETKLLRIGYSRCSIKDKFNKQVGRDLAQHRAEHKPVIVLQLAEGEVLSHVFFEQARCLTSRVLRMKHFKF